MNLPRSSWLVIGLWAAAGAVAIAVSVSRVIGAGWPGGTDVVLAVVFGTLMAASWVWPIMLYIDNESDAFVLDEACFVLLILLVPGDITVLVFAAVSVVAQLIRRRPFAKSLFNVGQVVASAAVATLVFALLHGQSTSIGYAKVGAAVAGVVCYYVVNTGAMVTIMATLGTPWRRTVVDGIGGKLLVICGSVAIAIPTALLLAREPKYLPLAVLPLVILRIVGAGHFYALHDRARLRGLFEATLDVNRAKNIDETRTAVLHAASLLLRSPEATLTSARPEGDDLTTSFEVAGEELWLGVSGRSRTEPFDDADQTLLEALAAVGSIALAKTNLLDEVQQQKDKLSVITSSLGEGVCAIGETGEITFLNPAGASMLGWYTIGAGGGNGGGGPILPANETPRFLLDPAMRAIALRRNVTSYDTRFERPDGSHFPVTMTASPVVGDSSPSGAVIVFRDTSERKAFEEQLARHAFQDALDRPGQPAPPARPPGPRAAAGRSDREPGRRPVLRHRPLQGRQRQPGPPGGRRAPPGHRRPAAPGRAAR